MKAKDIQIGGHYSAKISNRIVTVRVDDITDYRGYGARDGYTGGRKVVTKKAYNVTNLSTKRQTTFHSAAKFRFSTTELNPFKVGDKVTVNSSALIEHVVKVEGPLCLLSMEPPEALGATQSVHYNHLHKVN